MSQHDLVSAQTSNVCVTRHAPLNAIAYIVFVKQFVMSLPAISLGDWFSVNGKGGTGVSACTLQMMHTTYVRTNIPTYVQTYQRTYASSTMSQHCGAEIKTHARHYLEMACQR